MWWKVAAQRRSGIIVQGKIQVTPTQVELELKLSLAKLNQSSVLGLVENDTGIQKKWPFDHDSF